MTRGERFAKSVRANYDLNEAEQIIVDEIAAVLDILEAGGMSRTEERQQRTLLSRLMYQLALPPTDEDRRALTSTKASRAARARWQREGIN